MGIAFLENGKRMDYEDYLKTPEWRAKKINRLAIDNWCCGFCHCDVSELHYETHHLNYSRLGHENIETDLITLCNKCHVEFHKEWKKQDYWQGNESPFIHWKTYSLEDTAKLCAECKNEDVFFGGEYNLCSLDTISGFIDQYYRLHEVEEPLYILDKDILLYIRNKRYEILFEAVENKIELETLLDNLYGQKGVKGGNKVRAKAKQFLTKYSVAAMKRIYKENESINVLMMEVKKYE